MNASSAAQASPTASAPASDDRLILELVGERERVGHVHTSGPERRGVVNERRSSERTPRPARIA
jgi:hypothetical protein